MNIRIEDAGCRIWKARCAQVFARSQLVNPECSKGFTLFEFIIVISIVSVLVGFFLTRVPSYQEQAEKAAMQQVVAAMRSALVMRYSALVARGAANEKELQALAAANPVNWLQEPPRNYAGEYYDPMPKTVPPGNWMFDLKSRELIYVVDHDEDFAPGSDGKKWIRFHVKLGYDEPAGRPGSSKVLASVLFEPVEPYHWLDQ